MGNCLITKLKESVINDNLDYFDALQIKVDWDAFKGTGSYVDFRIIESGGGNHFGGVGVKVKVLNNGVIKVNDVAIADDEYIVESGKKVYIAPMSDNYSANTEFLLIGLSNIDMFATNKNTGYTIKNVENVSSGGYKDWCVSKLNIPSVTIEVGRDNLYHPLDNAEIYNIIAKNINTDSIETFQKDLDRYISKNPTINTSFYINERYTIEYNGNTIIIPNPSVVSLLGFNPEEYTFYNEVETFINSIVIH